MLAGLLWSLHLGRCRELTVPWRWPHVSSSAFYSSTCRLPPPDTVIHTFGDDSIYFWSPVGYRITTVTVQGTFFLEGWPSTGGSATTTRNPTYHFDTILHKFISQRNSGKGKESTLSGDYTSTMIIFKLTIIITIY